MIMSVMMLLVRIMLIMIISNIAHDNFHDVVGEDNVGHGHVDFLLFLFSVGHDSIGC